MYGKVVNNKLVLAGDAISAVYAENEELRLKDGYYPVEFDTPCPEGYEPDGFILRDSVIRHNFVNRHLGDTYKDKRGREYPPIEEQLDMLYWDKVYGTNVWFETIAAIKDKYPKE